MDELLAELARRLVDEPDAVRVAQVEGDDGSLIVRAGGPFAGRRLQLEIVG